MEATWHLGALLPTDSCAGTLSASYSPCSQTQLSCLCKKEFEKNSWQIKAGQVYSKVHPNCTLERYHRDLRQTVNIVLQGQGLGLLSYVQESSTCELATVFLSIC